MPTQRIFLITLLLLAGISCKQGYLPPVLQGNPGYLVVEGVINTAPGSITTFQLSRTQGLGDSVGAYTPEKNAQVSILDNTGASWPLREATNGTYTSDPLSLSTAGKYRLKIVTGNGTQYLSDTVSVHSTPPIDSLTWNQDDSLGDVHIRANTHDPAGNSHYYRWFFSETWEYHSIFYSELVLINNRIEYADTNTSTYTCWRGDNSTDILLASTSALSQDRVNQAQIAVLPRGSQKLSSRYSMLATQYVLSADAYKYWQIMQKNTQNLGSLFDPQPSQLQGNYHCVSHPNEPVIGYLSASSLQQLRLFIPNSQVHNWDTAHNECQTVNWYSDPNDFHNYTYTDTLFGPFYFVSGGGLILTKRTCIDCRLQGGTTQRPSFW
jgi:hypothetical protein